MGINEARSLYKPFRERLQVIPIQSDLRSCTFHSHVNSLATIYEKQQLELIPRQNTRVLKKSSLTRECFVAS